MALHASPLPRRPLTAIGSSVFLASLGTSIANVRLPTLADHFGARAQQVQWVVIAYLVASTALIMRTGRLGDLFGRRRMLLVGIIVFTLTSTLCVISKRTGWRILLWVIEVRFLTRPAEKTSATLRPTRSQPRSLLSMARLKSARSRIWPASLRRMRIAQIYFGMGWCFWPAKRPLLQADRQARMTERFVVGMAVPPLRRMPSHRRLRAGAKSYHTGRRRSACQRTAFVGATQNRRLISVQVCLPYCRR